MSCQFWKLFAKAAMEQAGIWNEVAKDGLDVDGVAEAAPFQRRLVKRSWLLFAITFRCWKPIIEGFNSRGSESLVSSLWVILQPLVNE